jgi:putative nucleotidyltransferase with HDIG domain
MNQPDKPLNLELLPGGAREAMRDLLSGADGEGGSELSPDVLEALAVDSPLLPPREPLGVRVASYFGRHQLLLLLGCFLALWAILSVPLHLGEGELQVGVPSPREVVAPQTAFAFDAEETGRRRESAAALVPPAYDPDPSALGQVLGELPVLEQNARRAARAALSDLTRLQAAPLSTAIPTGNRTTGNRATGALHAPLLPRPSLETLFARRAGWKAPDAVVRTLAKSSDERLELIERVTQNAVSQVYVQGRLRSDVPGDQAAIRPILRRATSDMSLQNGLSGDETALALSLGARAARVPNVVVNARKTESARREARETVAPVFQKIAANTSLVREGERISSTTFALLQELGLVTPRVRPFDILATGALCALLVMSAAFYLARLRRDLLARPAALWLVAFVPILFVGVFRAILRVPHADFLMVPLAATAAMLVTVLLDTRVGLPVAFVVAALCSLMARSDAGLFLGATLSAWVGSLSVATLSSRFVLGRSALILAATNALLALALGTLRGEAPDELASGAAWSALAGLASVGVMAAGALVLEKPFGITSHLRLLELLAPDETIIRRMQVEAPGTYTHSLMVAALGEAAAKSVGADPLLCRVAGLYHDVGKLRRPHCFIENQSGDNIHDRIAPTLSALLIKAHVKDGLELGRALRLPSPVLDAIASHHGKSLIAYFYARAKQNAGENAVDERVFRYPGPRPQTREAAILMLADAIEASARTLTPHTPEAIALHIETLVAARLSEGELDECDLSLREIGLVREAFVTTLRGVLHGRIAYPDAARLQGELAAPASDWVRQTLGDDSRRAPSDPASKSLASQEAPIEGVPPASSRSKGRRLSSAPEANSTHAPTANQSQADASPIEQVEPRREKPSSS